MKNHENKFMQEAINLAKNNVINHNGGPFGAVIVKNGKIIGKGANMVSSNNDPTAHAEIIAIRNACKKLNSFHLEECEIYTSCEPCPMCLAAIYWANIKKIYFAATKSDAKKAGFDDSFIYNQFKISIKKRKIPSENLSRKNSLEIFQLWMDEDNKILY